MAWNVETPDAEYYDHTHTEQLAKLVAEANDQPEIAIDTETTGLVTWKDIPLYWSMAWAGRKMALNASTLPYFAEVFASKTRTWIFANAKYDTHILANVGINIQGRLADIQVMHSLLYEDRPHGLKEIAAHVLGWRWKDFQDTFGKISVKKGVSASDVILRAEKENFNLLVEYASNDAWGTWCAYNKLKAELQDAVTHSLYKTTGPRIATLWDLFDKIEVPYTKVLWKNERNGIKIDRERLEKVRPIVRADLEQLERDISKLRGKLFNPKSAKQLEQLLFEELKLKSIKQTKGGKTGVRKNSVDEDVLKYYAHIPIIGLILQHRDLSKLEGTYLDNLYDLMDPFDRIHTRFNQDVARTGRLSSSGPNLQNIPTVENDKWKLRDAFIADDGDCLIAADYQQLEMRLLAAAAEEEGMIGVFLKNWDIHMGNASLMFNIPYDDIENATKVNKKVKAGEMDPSEFTPYLKECVDARKAAKAIGFGLNYGMGTKKLAVAIGCDKEEAEEKVARYFETYPAVKQFYAAAIEEAEQTGFSFTVLGRRRSVPELFSHRGDERNRGERVAVNTQIQGSAADVAKMAQIMCDVADVEGTYGARPLLAIHDELVFQCPKDTVEAAKVEIKEWMEHSMFSDLAVPLTVDIGSGKSWMEAK